MKKNLSFLGFGLLFGFALSRVGASDFNLIFDMFVLDNLKLPGVMLMAILVGFIGMRILTRWKASMRSGEPLKISEKKLGKWGLAGALVFGLGWGMSGACPGTVLAQLGEGKLLGFATFAGMILGTYIYALLKQRVGSTL
jgi:uncharacterized membrane protein YedE/YeeE